ncbi:hypothetical protein AVEN_7968-1, partial [Araneus ventricosus]
ALRIARGTEMILIGETLQLLTNGKGDECGWKVQADERIAVNALIAVSGGGI